MTGQTLDVQWHSAAAGTVAVRVFEAPATGAGRLVWAHGGSWLTGSVHEWHEPCAELAALSGWTVVSVEYRLGPANPYPAGVDDVLTVLRWAAQPGVPLAVGGDSAGGTLAASAAQAWRSPDVALAAQVLAYPPLDPDCAYPSFADENAGFPRREHMLRSWRSYAGAAEASALTVLRADDVRGLPRAVLAVGDNDPVRDELKAYRQRLTAAGVPVAFREFAGTEHGAFIATDETGQQLRAWLAREVARHG